MRSIPRHWFWILAVALGLRLTAIVVLREPALSGDAESYHNLAVSLVENHQFWDHGRPTAYRSPAYPFFLAGIYLVTGISPFAALIVQAFLGTWTVLLLMSITRYYDASNRARLWVGGLASCYPFFLYYTARLLTETFVIFLLTMAWWSFSRWRKDPGSWSGPLLWGLSSGVLILTKSVLAPWAALTMGLILLESGRRGHPRRWIHFTAASVCLLILPLFWAVRNDRVLGRPVLDTHGGMTCMECMVFYDINKEGRFTSYFYGGHPLEKATASLGEIDRDAVFMNEYRRFIHDHPRRFLRQALANLKDLWRLYPRQDVGESQHNRGFLFISLLTEPLLLGFGLWGLWTYRRDGWDWHLAWSAMTLLTVAHMLTCAQMRYRLPLVPFFMVAAALKTSRLFRPS